MSRKTRKLMWSVPLVAVLAVAGALAIFAALAPNEATAHEAAMHGPPGPVSGLTANTATGNDANGQPAARTQIVLTWMAPGTEMNGAATSYRIDYAEDTPRVWKNLLGGEESDTMLTDAMADDNCAADAADGMRCFTDMTPMPGTTRHYRVFAVNGAGTSPVSVMPTYATETTMDYGNPSAVLGLTATTNRREEIELNWQAPMDLGGATLLFYCLAVDDSASGIPDLTDTATPATAAACLNAEEATDADDVPVYSGSPLAFPTTGGTIVVDGDTTMFTHEGLAEPDTVSLYYRVYAVTDRDGDPDTTNDQTPPVTNERYVSLAASNVANGRTIAPLPTVDTSVTTTPRGVTNLRYVVDNGAGTDYQVRLYWTHPSNYPGPFSGTPSATNINLRLNWTIDVDRWDPNGGDDNNGDWVDLAADTVLGLEQWNSAAGEVSALGTGPMLLRIRYVNDPTGPGTVAADPDVTADVADDEVPGAEVRITIARASGDKFNADNLPRIIESTSNGDTGLRFRHNDVNPTTWIDLDWDADRPSSDPLDENYDDVPTGYGIDVSEDAGTTWQAIPDAIDLGATTRYTHKNVVPGKEYTYRVFPSSVASLVRPAGRMPARAPATYPTRFVA